MFGEQIWKTRQNVDAVLFGGINWNINPVRPIKCPQIIKTGNVI